MLDLIPLQYRALAAALAALLVFALGAAAGWTANGWRLTVQLEHQGRLHSDTLGELARAATQQLQIQQIQRQQLEAELAGIDQQHYQELQHAQTVTDSLTADLVAARQRMSVRTTGTACRSAMPATPGATSMDDGAERADIHPEDAAAIARITGDADRCAVKLTALQAWARTVWKPAELGGLFDVRLANVLSMP